MKPLKSLRDFTQETTNLDRNQLDAIRGGAEVLSTQTRCKNTAVNQSGPDNRYCQQRTDYPGGGFGEWGPWYYG